MVCTSVGIFLMKKLLNALHPIQILFYQYLCSLVVITLVGFCQTGGTFFDVKDFWLAFLGIFFAMGVFMVSKAFKINLSRSIVINQFSNQISILLSVIFLGKLALLDVRTTKGLLSMIGMVMTIPSVILMRGIGKGKVRRDWLVWILLSIVLIGTGMFLAKVFISKREPIEVLFFQYIGSFISVLFAFLPFKRSLCFESKKILLSLLTGFFLSLGMLLLYKAYEVSSLIYVNSFRSVGITLLCIIIGLVIFNEKRALNKKSLLGMFTGFVAILFVVLSGLL